MSSEAIFSKLLKKHMPIEAHWQRIETGSTGTGIPDVNVCHLGQDIWIELKLVKGRKVDLSPTQVAWLTKRSRVGGVTWIMARHTYDGPKIGKGDAIYLWPGSMAKSVLRDGIKCRLGVREWSAPFDWPYIIEVLFKQEE